jgi:hypothetical protein
MALPFAEEALGGLQRLPLRASSHARKAPVAGRCIQVKPRPTAGRALSHAVCKASGCSPRVHAA